MPITTEGSETTIEQEFGGADFADKRLSDRLLKLARSTMKKPTSTINQAESDWYATKAAYNFFNNKKVTAEKIVMPHQQQTSQRMQGYDWLLSLQDTVFFNYSQHTAVKDLGKIGKGEQGLIMHHSLISTIEGLPLGTLSQKIWTRQAELAGKQRQLVPIEEKESMKWIDTINECETRKPAHVNLVHVADREADIYEYLHHSQVHNYYYLVRARSPREITEEFGDTLATYVTDLAVAGQYEVNVTKRKGDIPSRVARVSVRFGQVEIKPSSYLLRKDATLNPLRCWVIYALEDNPPEGVEPLTWVLLTNVPTKNYQDALRRIDWYKLRWLIEVYHKVIKSGCLVEDCRLEGAKKLACYLALNSVIAWRLLWIKYMNNCAPTDKCTMILTKREYRILYSKLHKTKQLPNRTPTVRQATRWIARLGGFLARKGDGEPGIITLWRGWQRLHDYVDICSVLDL